MLDIAVSLTRKVIEKLAGVCAADPAAGMAAARLRGLTATACFAPLSVLDAAAGGGGAEEGPVRKTALLMQVELHYLVVVLFMFVLILFVGA